MITRIAIALFTCVLAGCSASATTPAARVRIAMVTDLGGLGDRSFNDSAYAGLREAKAQLHAQIAVLQSREQSDYAPNLTDLAVRKYDQIIAIGFLMADATAKAADRFPDRRFTIIDAVVDRPSVTSVTFHEEQGSFLAGAAAAMASKTHHVAFLGGIDIALIRKFEAGFTAGARQIDPKIVVNARYVGSFDDEAAGRRISSDLFASGADVIFVAAGAANLGAVDAVKARSNAYIIGVDSDQDGLAPGKVLTSMVKRVDHAVFDVATATAEHKPLVGHIELGLKEDAVGLTDFRYTRSVIDKQKRAMIESLRAAIIAGKIVPPTTREAAAAYTRVQL